jgi:hypothetical protein
MSKTLEEELYAQRLRGLHNTILLLQNEMENLRNRGDALQQQRYDIRQPIAFGDANFSVAVYRLQNMSIEQKKVVVGNISQRVQEMIHDDATHIVNVAAFFYFKLETLFAGVEL